MTSFVGREGLPSVPFSVFLSVSLSVSLSSIKEPPFTSFHPIIIPLSTKRDKEKKKSKTAAIHALCTHATPTKVTYFVLVYNYSTVRCCRRERADHPSSLISHPRHGPSNHSSLTKANQKIRHFTKNKPLSLSRPLLPLFSLSFYFCSRTPSAAEETWGRGGVSEGELK
jgi:hypothetical protein